MMFTITVRYFAVLRERRGKSTESLAVPPGTTMSSLFDSLFPGVGPVGFARNRTLVAGDTAITDGDEIAFLPPLGGG